jgi:hypothetical protein
MANDEREDPRVYQALALPNDALEKGGVEILRAGIIQDELYISALPVFKDAGQWGEVLSEVARRLGAIYAAQNPSLDKKDVIIAIAEGFVADFGASPVKAKSNPRPAKKTAKKKPAKTLARKKR